MKMNPILKKELVLGARSVKFPVALLCYSGCMSAVALFAMETICDISNYYYRTSIDFESLNTMFIILACMQLGMICIIIPVLTAGSIAGERERQTLDIMLTAPVSTFSVVMGKLMAALCNIFLFVISSIPAMAIAFLYGGIKWQYLVVFVVSIMCVAFLCGAIGVWCSSLYKKTVISVIMTMVMEAAFMLGSIGIYVGTYLWKYYRLLEHGNVSISASDIKMGYLPLILLLNPLVGFADAMFKAYSGVSGIETFLKEAAFGTSATSILQLCPYWFWITMALTILCGFFFVKLASRRINPVLHQEKRVKVKKKKEKKEKKKSRA